MSVVRSMAMMAMAGWVCVAVTAVGCTGSDSKQDDDDDDDGTGYFEGPIGLDDVSVLIPLPAEEVGIGDMMRLSLAGVGGPLLTEARFEEITLFQENPTFGTHYENWRIVGRRIDPCFPSLSLMETDPAKCRRQLRLIA